MIKKKTIFIWIFTIALIVTPFVCNILIGLKKPNNIAVVGQPTDWLSFYGCYIGSVISTIGAFVVLSITIKDSDEKFKQQLRYSQNRLEQEFRHKEILVTVDDLVDRVASFNPEEIIRISKIAKPTQQQLQEELSYLESLRKKYKALGFSATLLYDGSNNTSEAQLLEIHSKLVTDVMGLIKETYLLLSKHLNDEKYDGLLKELKNVSLKIDIATNECEKLMFAAKTYYDYIVYDFNKNKLL